MQQFDDNVGVRRNLDITNMKVTEVKEYYFHHLELNSVEKNKRIRELKEKIIKSKGSGAYEWILAIKFKDGKIIGKIEVIDIGNNKAYLRINLPNESKKMKYGVEALDQFLKICRENKYFSMIELEKENSTVEKYIRNHNLEDYVVEVA